MGEFLPPHRFADAEAVRPPRPQSGAAGRTLDAFLNRVGEMQKRKWKSAGKKNNFRRTLL